MIAVVGILIAALVVAIIVFLEETQRASGLLRALEEAEESSAKREHKLRQDFMAAILAKDDLIERKRGDNAALGRRLGGCQRTLKQTTELAAGARDMEMQRDTLDAALTECNEQRVELENQNRKFIEQLATFRREPAGTIYFEAEVPSTAYAALKRSIIESLGGRVALARNRRDEAGS